MGTAASRAVEVACRVCDSNAVQGPVSHYTSEHVDEAGFAGEIEEGCQSRPMCNDGSNGHTSSVGPIVCPNTPPGPGTNDDGAITPYRRSLEAKLPWSHDAHMRCEGPQQQLVRDASVHISQPLGEEASESDAQSNASPPTGVGTCGEVARDVLSTVLAASSMAVLDPVGKQPSPTGVGPQRTTGSATAKQSVDAEDERLACEESEAKVPEGDTGIRSSLQALNVLNGNDVRGDTQPTYVPRSAGKRSPGAQLHAKTTDPGPIRRVAAMKSGEPSVVDRQQSSHRNPDGLEADDEMPDCSEPTLLDSPPADHIYRQLFSMLRRMFHHLYSEELDRIVTAFREWRLPAGTVIAEQGRPAVEGPAFCMLHRGVVDVMHRPTGATESDKVCTYDRPGQCFGELERVYSTPGGIDRRKQWATIVTRTNTVLWIVQLQVLRKALSAACI